MTALVGDPPSPFELSCFFLVVGQRATPPHRQRTQVKRTERSKGNNPKGGNWGGRTKKDHTQDSVQEAGSVQRAQLSLQSLLPLLAG